MSFCIIGLKKGQDLLELAVKDSNGEEQVIRIRLTLNKRNTHNAWLGVEANKDKVKITRLKIEQEPEELLDMEINGNQ